MAYAHHVQVSEQRRQTHYTQLPKQKHVALQAACRQARTWGRIDHLQMFAHFLERATKRQQACSAVQLLVGHEAHKTDTANEPVPVSEPPWQFTYIQDHIEHKNNSKIRNHNAVRPCIVLTKAGATRRTTVFWITRLVSIAAVDACTARAHRTVLADGVPVRQIMRKRIRGHGVSTEQGFGVSIT